MIVCMGSINGPYPEFKKRNPRERFIFFREKKMADDEPVDSFAEDSRISRSRSRSRSRSNSEGRRDRNRFPRDRDESSGRAAGNGDDGAKNLHVTSLSYEVSYHLS